jgi:hypothetical protein
VESSSTQTDREVIIIIIIIIIKTLNILWQSALLSPASGG